MARTTTRAKTIQSDGEGKSIVKASPAPRKKLDPTMEVPCYNNTTGKLYYESKRMKSYSEEWLEKNDVAYIELGELRSMARTQPRFFSEGWIRIDDPDVIADLHVERYYKDVLFADEVDRLFTMKPAELKKKLADIAGGNRMHVILRAREMMENGKLDSMQIVSAIEEVLHCELTER
jgi:hypothetical protein